MKFSEWPCYDDEEIEAVVQVLKSGKVNYWTGTHCREFEAEFANFSGTQYAIAVANGTVALDLALIACGLGVGDEVIVTSRTYLASVSSIVNAGCTPIFADVNPVSQNITADTISAALTSRTRAIVCVHLAGWPCDMDPILALAQEKGLFVIEDCAQAHGALYKGRPVGSLGNVACWSFCQDKIITTGGEGGMVTTNDHAFWSKMWSYKDHGKSWEAVYKQNHPPGFRWLHESFGTNWRMTEIQAVIGLIQLRKLPVWQARRLKYAKQIWSAAEQTNEIEAPRLECTGCFGGCEKSAIGCRHAAYKCYAFVKSSFVERDEIMAKINDKGVPCFSGSCSEVYLEKAFANTGFRPKERLPIAKRLGETSLMFLCHPSLQQNEVDRTCEVIQEVAD